MLPNLLNLSRDKEKSRANEITTQIYKIFTVQLK